MQDGNKGIRGIRYNLLNLPEEVATSNGNIRYTYDAMGNKLKKTRTEGQNVEGTLYISGIQYIKEGNGPWQMEFVQTAEGRVADPMGNRLYEYDLKDHLGNSRVMFSETGETISEVAGYYPFGMTFDHPNVPGDHKYLYNGKEFQNELGLETYDFEWRMYDPAIARTFQLDPHSDNYLSLSPYTWAANNPLRFIDPDGKDIININGGVRFTGLDAQIAFKAIQQNNYKGIHLVEEKNTLSIYKHTLNAFREGKPEVLHYDSDKNRQKQRRNEALANYPRKGDGTSRDEYPYASTFEGGKGALVTYVPVRENSIQGGKLGALYRTLDQGDAFLVLPVPKDREPAVEPEPIPVIPAVPVPRTSPALKPSPAFRFLRTINPLLWMPIVIPPDFYNSPSQPEG